MNSKKTKHFRCIPENWKILENLEYARMRLITLLVIADTPVSGVRLLAAERVVWNLMKKKKKKIGSDEKYGEGKKKEMIETKGRKGTRSE